MDGTKQDAQDDLRQARDRETALRDVLDIISRSRDDAAPVFQAVLDTAMRICGGSKGAIVLGEEGGGPQILAAHSGAHDGAVERYRTGAYPMDPEHSLAALAIIQRQTLHYPDVAKGAPYREGMKAARIHVEQEGIRSSVYVPLIAGGKGIGCLNLLHTTQHTHSEDEIALLETFAAQAVIAIENVRQFHDLQSRLEREAATREILSVISQSRDDEMPVFDVILRNAARLCNAPMARLHLPTADRTEFELVAEWGDELRTAKIGERWPMETTRQIPQSMIEARTIHMNMAEHPGYLNRDSAFVKLVEQDEIRSRVTVPLVSRGLGIGCITLSRREVAPFAKHDIKLVETFAAQAVIAIENVRQFRELQMRLQREAATSEVLAVISTSRDNETPVFDAILENTARLCETDLATLNLVNEEGTHLEYAAHHGRMLSTYEVGVDRWALDSTLQIAQSVREARLVHNVDLRETDLYLQGDKWRRQLVDDEGVRTFLTVPLMSANGKPIGCIGIYRKEVRAFSEYEITLVETFAAQAVIAIENVRQFREVQERLQREAATREILEVISQSRDDEQPVFDAILQQAAKLCKAPLSYLCMPTGDGAYVFSPARQGMFASFGKTLDDLRVPLATSPLALARAIKECAVFRIADIADDDLYRSGNPDRVSMVEDEGARSLLVVPLIKGGRGVGSITLYRREVAPFSDDDVALVESFAAQAVIAIENVRQFRELQTRLEREAASREILEVISQSRDDERPVFDAILKQAASLCRAPQAGLLMANEARTHVKYIAGWGPASKHFQVGVSEWAIDDPIAVTTAIRENRIVNIPDLLSDSLTDERHPSRIEIIEEEGIRSVLAVPLISGGKAIGCFDVYRLEADPFTDDEVALIEIFAAQAVIAIENVRQFRELQTRLEREAASGEILTVISQSRDDELPVFNTILENALRLCDADMAVVNAANDAMTEVGYAAGINSAGPEFQPGRDSWPIDSEMFVCRAIRENRTFHTTDLKDTDLYRSGDPTRRNLVDNEGMRIQLVLPLRQGDKAIAAFSLYRCKVQPFSDSEIALLETFAAQAVIAIENVRQFRDLQIRLEREAATRGILEVISRSRSDYGPVFDRILDDALRLCDAEFGGVVDYMPEDSHVRLVRQRGLSVRAAEMYRDDPPPFDPDASIIARSILQARTIHVDLGDLTIYRGESRYGALAAEEGIRTGLFVPLMIDDRCVGLISLIRYENRDFNAEQIALLETFAAQAAIAIENVRHFRDLQIRLEREAASRDILEVISQSRDDETPVFDSLLQNAARLCKAENAGLVLVADDEIHFSVAATLLPQAGFVPGEKLYPLDLDLGAANCMREARIIHRRDVREVLEDKSKSDLSVSATKLLVDEGVRTTLWVPLLRGGVVIGSFGLYRHEVREFADDEIALVETFAAQAVIAIENVRQFKALEARTEEVQALNAGLEERVEEQVGEIERMGKLKSFLPSAVADAVVSSGGEDMLKSHRALLGILFCDIRGFTAFCETAEPEETMAVLQTYHQEMGRLIADHGAGVDHRMGDGIMVLFNDPIPCDDPAGHAVRLAMAMREKMTELCKSWKKLGHRLGFGVGVSLGYATVGMVGYEGRADYTASGTAVNLAARLCDKAEDGEILLSPRAAIAVEDEVVCEPGGELELKGLAAPVVVTRAVALH